MPLRGGGAAYARGAALPMHDVDFVIVETDKDAAAAAFESSGMRVARPPEGWLIKAFDDDRMIDLIFRLAGHQDTRAVLDRAEEVSVAAVPMRVLTATDLTTSWLAAFSEHHADFAATLTCVRPLREQVDWARVRAETDGSAFATAFLVLLFTGGSYAYISRGGDRCLDDREGLRRQGQLDGAAGRVL
jgi:hypothetical protein